LRSLCLKDIMGDINIINDDDTALLLSFIDKYVISDKNINTFEIMERIVKDMNLDKIFLDYFVFDNNEYLINYTVRFFIYFYKTRYFRNLQEEIEISSEDSVKIANNIKKKLIQRSIEKQSTYISNNISKKKYTVNDVYKLYSIMRNYRSDDNELSNAILEFIIQYKDENIKLGLKQIKIGDNIVAITNLKSSVVPIYAKGFLLQQKPYSEGSIFKLTSILLNGFTNIQEFNNGEDPIIKLVKINDIEKTLNIGTIVYFLKLVNIMCKAYLFVNKFGTNEQFKAFEKLLTTNDVTLSQKQNASISILYTDKTLKFLTINDVVEDIYSLPTPRSFSNMFKDKVLTTKIIKESLGDSITSAILEPMLKESTFSDLVKINNKTISNFKIYKDQFPTLVEFLLKELGTSLFETTIVQIVSFSSNLGNTYISAINEIIDEVNIKPPPPKEKLNSKIQRLKFFNINISGEILELLNVSITEKDNTKKKELGYDVVKKSGDFIKSLFKK